MATDQEPGQEPVDVPTEPATPLTESNPASSSEGDPSSPTEGQTSSQLSEVPSVQPPHKSRKRLVITLVVIAVLLLGGGAAALYYSKHHAKKATPATQSSSSPNVATTTPKPDDKPVAKNVWTGKAGTYSWKDAANWSLGTPVSGQDLEINVADVTKSDMSIHFENDLSGVTLHRLIIDGQVPTFGAYLTGEPLTVTDGIEMAVTQPSTLSAVPQFQVNTMVKIAGTASIKTSGRDKLTLQVDGSGTALDIGKQTLSVTAADSSDFSVYGSLTGTGKLQFPDQPARTDGMYFDTASPAFGGTVLIGKNNRVWIRNNNGIGGTGTVSPFGTAAITIADGGVLTPSGNSTRSFTLANDITMSGRGMALEGGSTTGDYTGAIQACLTAAQQGCGDGIQVTLTGTVTLAGDTQLGASYGVEAPVVPTGTTVTYIFKKLVANGHTLSAVPSSQVVIQR